MNAHGYSAPSGRCYVVRIATPADEPALARMLGALDPEEIRLRFFMPMRAFGTVAQLMLEDDERLHFAFIASPADAPAEIAGTGMLSVLPDRSSAEFALVVHHAHARRGLGGHLLRCLLDAARDHGVAKVFGLVLRENAAMLGLARAAGFTAAADPGCPGAMRVEIVLAAERAVA